MKIATKIALGYGVLIALLLGVLAYQLTVISRTAQRSQELSAINFRAGVLVLQLLRDLDQIEEFTQKFFVTTDPAYGEQVTEIREAFSQVLQEIRSLRLSDGESQELGRLELIWSQLGKPAQPPEQRVRSRNPEQLEAALEEELEPLNRVRLQTLGFLRATRQAIESQVAASAEASRRAQQVSWVAAISALLVSLTVSFWIVGSISRPLGRLTEATHAVAAGRFSYRVQVEGKDELAQLARDFDAMTRRLNELDELKKDFVSHVSHELKSPLASLQETARLLLDEIPGPLTPDQRRFLQLSLQSSRRLSSMIGDLLDLSRIEAGVMQYQMRPQDLGALVRTAVAEFEIQLQAKNLRVETEMPEEPLVVACDGDRILQVIGNVLGNALKFSPAGGTIRVRLCSTQEAPASLRTVEGTKGFGSGGAGYALVTIADAGPGIPDSEKGKIFEKFHQARAARGLSVSPAAKASGRRTALSQSIGGQGGSEPSPPVTKLAGRGVGLGLAIARTIIEAHQGAIWVEDSPGGGSVFHILLAAGTVPLPRESTPTTSPI